MCKSLFPDSSSVSFQLSIFSSSLLFTTLQPFFPLFSLFFVTINFTSSWVDCSKSQSRFIFPRCLHSCYISCQFFFSSLHCCYTCFLAIPFNLIIAIPKTVLEIRSHVTYISNIPTSSIVCIVCTIQILFQAYFLCCTPKLSETHL
jgi:hypothetical protein